MTSEKVFHYTNVSGLMGILETQSIYATHFKFLNDPTEFDYATAGFRKLLEKAVNDYVDRHKLEITLEKAKDELGLDSHSNDEEIRLEVLKKEAITISDAIRGPWLKYGNVFVASFSEHKNADIERVGLLSQWRTYGQGGGYAVEFDKTKLSDLATKEFDSHKYIYVRPEKVNYGSIEKANSFDNDTKIFFDVVYNSSDGVRRNELKKLTEHYIDALISTKPHAFFEESEWRIGCVALKEILPDFRVTSPIKKIHYRPSGGAIIPYIKLFEDIGSLPITGILIGPHSNQDRRKLSLEMFLKSYSLSHISVRTVDAQLANEL